MPYFANVGSKKTFEVWGSGFENIQNVYLSGSPLSSISTLQNPFSSTQLSADFGSFTGVKLASADWSYNRDSYMTFVMPSASTMGRLDVIVEGPVGYGKLTEFTRINTFNPFLSTDSKYNDYVPYQMNYLSGIEIV